MRPLAFFRKLGVHCNAAIILYLGNIRERGKLTVIRASSLPNRRVQKGYCQLSFPIPNVELLWSVSIASKVHVSF